MMYQLVWETLYATQSPQILGLCRRYVSDLRLAEDLMHDAFLTAIRKQSSYAGSGSPEAWLRRIALNTVLMYLRAEKKFTALAFDDLPDLPESQEETAPLSDQEIILSAGFSQTDLLEVLDLLPAHHRTVFNLYVFEDLNHKEIAQELGISLGTSKSHLARARKKIQVLLLEKAMKQKQKRAAIPISPTSGEEKHFTDALYRQELGNVTFTPQGQTPPALMEHFKKTPPRSTTSYAGHIAMIAGIATVIGLVVWYSQANSAMEMPENNLTGKADSSMLSLAPPTKRPAQIPDSVTTSRTPFSTPKQSTQSPPAPPEPVVVHKTVIRKDTVFQLPHQSSSHE